MLNHVQRFPELNQAGTYEVTYTIVGVNPKDANGNDKAKICKKLKLTVRER